MIIIHKIVCPQGCSGREGFNVELSGYTNVRDVDPKDEQLFHYDVKGLFIFANKYTCKQCGTEINQDGSRIIIKHLVE